MRRHSLLLPVLLLVTACHAPLAPTEHEVLDASSLAGNWEIAWLEVREPDDSEPPLVLGTLAVEDAGAAKPGRSTETLGETLRRVFLTDTDADPGRLILRFTWAPVSNEPENAEAETAEPPEPIRFDGQLVRVDGSRFLTLQRFAGGDWLDPWATPLQRTFRVTEDSETGNLTLSSHRLNLVWCPTPYAGIFRFDPSVFDDDEPHTGLVARFDDLLDYYGERPAAEWRPVLEARRVD